MPSKHPWLAKRGDTYYLRAKVPIDLLKIAGKAEIKKSLKTSDRRRAERLLRVEAADVERQFESWRAALAGPSSSVQDLPQSKLEELARDWFRERLPKVQGSVFLGTDQEQRDLDLHEAKLDESSLLTGGDQNLAFAQPHVEAVLARLGMEPDWKTSAPHDLTDLILRAELECVRLRMRLLKGDYSAAVSDPLFRGENQKIEGHERASSSDDSKRFDFKLAEWKAFLQTTMKPRQVDQYVADLRELSSEIRTIDDFRKRNLMELLESQKRALSNNTIHRKFSVYRHYWTYLEAKEIVSPTLSPFAGLKLPPKRPKTRRKAWAPAQVYELWHEARKRNQTTLAHVIKIGAYTGGRIEAICSIRFEDVGTDESGRRYIRFDDKTDAGRRDVSIHSKLLPLIEKLLNNTARNDGYLLDLGPSNAKGERSGKLGKQFGRLKTQRGYGPEYVFHSLRRTVVGLLSNIGCPEYVAADIVGHERPTMTYGTYRDETRLSDKAEWLEKAIRYDDALFIGDN